MHAYVPIILIDIQDPAFHSVLLLLYFGHFNGLAGIAIEIRLFEIERESKMCGLNLNIGFRLNWLSACIHTQKGGNQKHLLPKRLSIVDCHGIYRHRKRKKTTAPQPERESE